MKKNELKTPKELEREKVHSKIIAEYKAMTKRYPEASTWRIFTKIASAYQLTAMGVWKICVRNNVYQPKGVRA